MINTTRPMQVVAASAALSAAACTSPTSNEAATTTIVADATTTTTKPAPPTTAAEVVFQPTGEGLPEPVLSGTEPSAEVIALEGVWSNATGRRI